MSRLPLEDLRAELAAEIQLPRATHYRFQPFPGDVAAVDDLITRLLDEHRRRSRVVPLDGDAETRCVGCDCYEGQIHLIGCSYERRPSCGGQLIACDCLHRTVGARSGDVLTQNQEKAAMGLVLAGTRVPHVHMPLRCARCGSPDPTLSRAEVGAKAWKRYVPRARRGSWLYEPCFERVKSVVDDRSVL